MFGRAIWNRFITFRVSSQQQSRTEAPRPSAKLTVKLLKEMYYILLGNKLQISNAPVMYHTRGFLNKRFPAYLPSVVNTTTYKLISICEFFSGLCF